MDSTTQLILLIVIIAIILLTYFELYSSATITLLSALLILSNNTLKSSCTETFENMGWIDGDLNPHPDVSFPHPPRSVADLGDERFDPTYSENHDAIRNGNTGVYMGEDIDTEIIDGYPTGEENMTSGGSSNKYDDLSRFNTLEYSVVPSVQASFPRNLSETPISDKQPYMITDDWLRDHETVDHYDHNKAMTYVGDQVKDTGNDPFLNRQKFMQQTRLDNDYYQSRSKVEVLREEYLDKLGNGADFYGKPAEDNLDWANFDAMF